MSKISITYRATIDRHVPVAVRPRLKEEAHKTSTLRVGMLFAFIGERMRITT
jgi:hypothetical protein